MNKLKLREYKESWKPASASESEHITNKELHQRIVILIEELEFAHDVLDTMQNGFAEIRSTARHYQWIEHELEKPTP